MRRIRLMGAVVAAGSLAFGVAGPAVAGAKPKTKSTITVKSTCTMLLSDSIPVNATAIAPPLSSGTAYGSVSCHKLGTGLVANPFKQDDSGDTTGPIAMYFGLGSVHGKLKLAESSTQPVLTVYNFGAANLVGTMTIKGGTGAYKKAKGTGKVKCDTLDGIHFSCSARLKLTLPATS